MRRFKIALLIGLLALSGAACGEDDDGGGLASADGDSTETASADSGGGSDSDDIAEQGLAYSQCMRDNGIAEFPDPTTTEGGFNLQLPEGMDPEDEDFKAAEAACEDQRPSPEGGEPLDPEEYAELVEYSECMRENGVADFPDPQPDGSLIIDGDAFDPESDEFQAADEACQDLRPDGPA